MKRTLEVINIGKHKHVEYDFSDGQMIAFIGKNGTGKSTIIQSLETIFGVKGFMKKPVTDGEEKGKIIYEGQDKNGDDIRLEWEVEEDNSTGKFKAVTVIDGKVKKISNVNQIREIMGVYIPLDAQEAMNMIKYEGTRRKFIDDYIMQCIDKDIRERIAEIDIQISDSTRKECNDNVFHQRREAKRELEKAAAGLSALEVKDKQGNVLEIKTLQDIEEQLSAKITQLKQFNNRDSQFKDLETKLHHFGEAIKHFEEFEQDADYLRDLYKRITKLHSEEMEKIKEHNERMEETTQRLYRVREKMESVKSYNAYKEKQKDNFTLYDKLDKELEELREEKKILLSKSKLPAGLEINESEISFNGLPFDETVASHTEAQLAMIELMLSISDSPLVNIGDWSLYDQDSQSKIVKMAKDGKHLFIGQRVTEDPDVELEILIQE